MNNIPKNNFLIAITYVILIYLKLKVYYLNVIDFATNNINILNLYLYLTTLKQSIAKIDLFIVQINVIN